MNFHTGRKHPKQLRTLAKENVIHEWLMIIPSKHCTGTGATKVTNRDVSTAFLIKQMIDELLCFNLYFGNIYPTKSMN